MTRIENEKQYNSAMERINQLLKEVTDDTPEDDVRNYPIEPDEELLSLGQTIGEIPSETIERDPRLKSILGY